jgi:hypothetical protein
MDCSRHGKKKASERRALTTWRAQRDELVKTWKEANEREALTSWRAQRHGLVKTWKGSERPRGTHRLESTEGWTSQDMERRRASEGHSQTGEHRGMD